MTKTAVRIDKRQSRTGGAGNIDCDYCSNCTDCIGCINCQGCHDCTDCTDCYGLRGKTGWIDNKPANNDYETNSWDD